MPLPHGVLDGSRKLKILTLHSNSSFPGSRLSSQTFFIQNLSRCPANTKVSSSDLPGSAFWVSFGWHLHKQPVFTGFLLSPSLWKMKKEATNTVVIPSSSLLSSPTFWAKFMIFVHFLNQQILLSTCHMPGIVGEADDKGQPGRCGACSHEPYSLAGRKT